MYFYNGFVYGSEPEEALRVSRVKPLSDGQMILTFNNGEERLLDITELKGPAYAPLRNNNIFMKPSIDHGVVTWMNGEIDCSPDYMYEHSYEYIPVH